MKPQNNIRWFRENKPIHRIISFKIYQCRKNVPCHVAMIYHVAVLCVFDMLYINVLGQCYDKCGLSLKTCLQ